MKPFSNQADSAETLIFFGHDGRREEDVEVIRANDSVTKSGQFRNEAYVMPQVIVPS
jgi:hypothetical protein